MIQMQKQGNSLVVQRLKLHASTAQGTGSVPGRGTKIMHAAQHSQKKKKDAETRTDGVPLSQRSMSSSLIPTPNGSAHWTEFQK